ncbi:uncharacterized protein LOC121245863 [Juglans microcarpa x Juglans regia]|uniref:uncharacterized protein LOC121245863 n=1 Tax=Juglans microcarpa x Juglans regia TaxID=2249226 RepID=UPI001B7E9224|nr:uncharacterized protein LOC121245863 [Juglans microcarpa x Juglans regia]
MPFPMKIQPIDLDSQAAWREPIVRTDTAKPVLKSRFRRLFDRQLPSVLKISSGEKQAGGEAQYNNKDGGGAEFEPSSVCLARMVQNFIEQESTEKQSSTAAKFGRNRCNCFNGNINDSSDDELDVFACFGGEPITSGSSFGGDFFDILKTLIPCSSIAERNLLADTSKIVEKNSKIHKRKDDLKIIVTDSLSSLGYDSSICKSKWDKSSSYPAGEYEYIDVIVEGERLLIDIDFRSEFEIARSTGAYKAILQSLPYIFVGKSDRLGQIASIVSEAARQSLKKKGMPFPPWRKGEYMRAKWLSTYTRTTHIRSSSTLGDTVSGTENEESSAKTDSDGGELKLIFGEEAAPPASSPGASLSSHPSRNSSADEGEKEVAITPWQPPAVKPKSFERGAKMVTGLASLLKDKP